MKSKVYSYSGVCEAVSRLADDGYMVYEVPGCLVDGFICIAPDEKHWNFEFREVYLNEWSSGLSMRRFRELSQRQKDLIEKIENSWDAA